MGLRLQEMPMSDRRYIALEKTHWNDIETGRKDDAIAVLRLNEDYRIGARIDSPDLIGDWISGNAMCR